MTSSDNLLVNWSESKPREGPANLEWSSLRACWNSDSTPAFNETQVNLISTCDIRTDSESPNSASISKASEPEEKIDKDPLSSPKIDLVNDSEEEQEREEEQEEESHEEESSDEEVEVADSLVPQPDEGRILRTRTSKIDLVNDSEEEQEREEEQEEESHEEESSDEEVEVADSLVPQPDEGRILRTRTSKVKPAKYSHLTIKKNKSKNTSSDPNYEIR
ncbi:hypothetical protein MJO29_013367 [Puccinia striiformis f. sp. tritici]|nr:hypothetical protein MJO29_013367 [Puccinia striiformis f. sp. tritici]